MAFLNLEREEHVQRSKGPFTKNHAKGDTQPAPIFDPRDRSTTAKTISRPMILRLYARHVIKTYFNNRGQDLHQLHVMTWSKTSVPEEPEEIIQTSSWHIPTSCNNNNILIYTIHTAYIQHDVGSSILYSFQPSAFQWWVGSFKTVLLDEDPKPPALR